MTVPLGTQQDVREMNARGVLRAQISRELSVSLNTAAKYADVEGGTPLRELLVARGALAREVSVADSGV